MYTEPSLGLGAILVFLEAAGTAPSSSARVAAVVSSAATAAPAALA